MSEIPFKELLDKLQQDTDEGWSKDMCFPRAVKALRLLAARVEALDKRQPELRISVGDVRPGLGTGCIAQPADSGGPKREPSTAHYPLFDHMSRAHGLTLLESEMDEIVRVVHRMTGGPKREAVAELLFALESARARELEQRWAEARRLKPCPFCGSRLAVIRSNGIGDFFVICGDSSDDDNGCGARTSDVRCEGEEYAAERWNRRKP